MRSAGMTWTRCVTCAPERPAGWARAACAGMRSGSRSRPGTSRPACRTGFPGPAELPRGDVLDIGQLVRAGARPAADLLTASFIWGWGTAGYGPRRLRRIRSRAGDRLEPALRRVLDAVSKDAAAPDPVAGYARLYGGQASQDRAAPGQEPWSRLHGFGPAFFTKFLYFCTPTVTSEAVEAGSGVAWRTSAGHLAGHNVPRRAR
jgi:hypothetical protein